MEHLNAAIEALDKAQTHSYRVEQVLRWALSTLAKQRQGDPVPSEFDQYHITGMRSMEALQNAVHEAINQFRMFRSGGV